MATYSLSKIKTFTGMEGYGLNATILKDGKPIAFVMDDATGGEVDIDFTNPGQTAKSFQQHHATAKAEFALCAAFCRAWYEQSGGAAHDIAQFGADFDSDDRYVIEAWVNHTVDQIQNDKRLARVAKTKTLFRVEGDSADEWRTLGSPYSPKVQAWLDQKYPSKIVAIYGVL